MKNLCIFFLIPLLTLVLLVEPPCIEIERGDSIRMYNVSKVGQVDAYAGRDALFVGKYLESIGVQRAYRETVNSTSTPWYYVTPNSYVLNYCPPSLIKQYSTLINNWFNGI